MTPPPRPTKHTPELRALLAAAGFTREAVHSKLGAVGELLTKAAEVPVRLRRMGDADPLAILVRLLVLGADVEAARAEAVVENRLLELLGEHALVVRDGDRLRSPVRIVPHYDDILVAADRDEDTVDFVPGVQRPSGTLADLTLRRNVARALDVGTGSGIQALLLARHSEHVVATDVNERALQYAAFNAALNGLSNIEFRPGSFFEPVAGQEFDVIACNPPYVISPETAFTFRDSGLAGGRVGERVVRELPRHLVDGGFGTVLVSWPNECDDLAAEPRRWLEGSGCDAWVFYTAVDDPLTTASAWNRDRSADPAEYEAAIERWLAYYEQEGIRQLAYAAIVLRKRPSGDNWFRARPLPGTRTHAATHVERLFTAQDELAGIDDERLLSLRPTLVPEARLAQIVAVRDGALVLTEASLRLADGIGFAAELDANTFAIVRRLDGSRTLRDVAREVAAEADVGESDARLACLRMGRDLLELGFTMLRTDPLEKTS